MPLKFKKNLSTPILSGHGRSEGYIDVRTHTHEKNVVFVRAEEKKKKKPWHVEEEGSITLCQRFRSWKFILNNMQGNKIKSIILK